MDKILVVVDGYKGGNMYAALLNKAVAEVYYGLNSSALSREKVKNTDTYKKIITSYVIKYRTEVQKEELDKYKGVIFVGGKSKALAGAEEKTFQQNMDNSYPYLVLHSSLILETYWEGMINKESDSTQEVEITYVSIRSFLYNVQGYGIRETKTSIEYCVFPEDFKRLETLAKAWGKMGFDFETKPKQAGLEKKTDIKEHSVNHVLSEPTILSFTVVPEHGYIVPLFHYEVDMRYVGKDTRLVKDTTSNYYSFDGSAVTNYKGEAVEYDPEVYGMLEKVIAYCKEHDISNYFSEVLLPNLRKLFSLGIEYIAWNAKFDIKVAYDMGITNIVGKGVDAMMIVHALDENIPKGLKPTSKTYFPEFIGYGDNIDYANERLKPLSVYAASDTDLTVRCYLMLFKKLAASPELFRVFRSLEIPKVRVLSGLEINGLLLDVPKLVDTRHTVHNLIQELELKLREHPVVVRVNNAKKLKDKEEAIAELEAKLQEQEDKKLEFLRQKVSTLEAKQAKEAEIQKWKDKLKLVENKSYLNEDYPYSNIVKTFKKLGDISSGILPSEDINFNSPAQVQEIFYGESGLNNELPVVSRKVTIPYTKRKKTVVEPYPSTDKNELSRLDNDGDGLVNLFLTYKAAEKLYGTYIVGFLDKMGPDNRIHTSYSTIRSQRLSSSNPNFQNIPSRSKIPEIKGIVKAIKDSIIPSGDRVMAQIDLSQAELRVYASLGGITSMIESYVRDLDIHMNTAAFMSGMEYEEFASQDEETVGMGRYNAKALNFGAIYKISAAGFQNYIRITFGLDVDIRQSEEMLNAFFDLYPEILEYQQDQIRIGHRQGYVTTLFGSRRNLPNINSNNSEIASKDERAAINSPTQGTVGQMLVFSLIMLEDMLTLGGYSGKYSIINTVHDSIILEVDKAVAKEVFELAIWCCNNPPIDKYFNASLECPLKSDIEVGYSWTKMQSTTLDELENVL